MRAPDTAVASVLCALTITACGSSSSSSSSGSSSSAPVTTGQQSSASPLIQVKLANIAFVPVAVTAKVGQRITWINEDSVDHNVVARGVKGLHSPLLHSGDTFTFTPHRPGSIAYVCTIHPNMRATITV